MIRVLFCLFAVALLAANARAQTTAPSTIDLSGQWRFAMDPKDAGITEQWYNQTLPDKINLPGILQAQGYGDDISISTPWVAALPRDMRWYLLPQYKAYTQPGNVKMPYLSQPPRHYLGVAWYQRDIDIPAQSDGTALRAHAGTNAMAVHGLDRRSPDRLLSQLRSPAHFRSWFSSALERTA